MSEYELLLIIKDQSDGLKDFVETANELINDIENNPKKLAIKLSNELSEICDINECCPLCGETDFNYIQDGIETTEYFGREVEESIGREVCSNPMCSYSR